MFEITFNDFKFLFCQSNFFNHWIFKKVIDSITWSVEHLTIWTFDEYLNCIENRKQWHWHEQWTPKNLFLFSLIIIQQWIFVVETLSFDSRQEYKKKKTKIISNQMIEIVSTFLLTFVHVQTINEWNGTNTHTHARNIPIILPFYKLQIRLINKVSGNWRYCECARVWLLFTLKQIGQQALTIVTSQQSICTNHSIEYKYSLFAFIWSHFGLVVRFEQFFVFEIYYERCRLNV